MKRFSLIILFCIAIYCDINARDYNILDFGAKPDTTVMSTIALQEAVDVCSREGGGRVVIPSGSFVTGMIILKDNVELHLESGSILYGSRELGDYPDIKADYVSQKTRMLPYNRNVPSEKPSGTIKQMIYAEGASNVCISGFGEINGQGQYFSTKLFGGVGRPHLIRLISCRDVQVQNVSLKNGGAWTQHYLACERLQIKGIKVMSHANLNNDGLDLDCCKDVTVSDMICDSGDDAIVLKSTSSASCENIAITNCVLSSHCSAIKIGTETNGGFKNITVSNCVIRPSSVLTGLSKHPGGLSGIALEMVDGGFIDGICISNIRIKGTQTPIFIRLGNRARPYTEGKQVTQVGKIRNVFIDHVSIDCDEKMGCSITGIPGYPVENIHLSNIYLLAGGGGKKEDIFKVIPEKEKNYPEGNMFGDLPGYGFYIRHAKNITFRSGEVNAKKVDLRPSLYLEDVEKCTLSDLVLWNDLDAEASVFLKEAKNMAVYHCFQRGTPKFFIYGVGNDSCSIALYGNILSEQTKLVNDDLKNAIREP